MISATSLSADGQDVAGSAVIAAWSSLSPTWAGARDLREVQTAVVDELAKTAARFGAFCALSFAPCTREPVSDLLPDYLSQRLIDPVLPAPSGFLKVIKNLPVKWQRDKFLGIRNGRTLRREFRGFRGCRLEGRFSRIP